jgi:hypothetical protein
LHRDFAFKISQAFLRKVILKTFLIKNLLGTSLREIIIVRISTEVSPKILDLIWHNSNILQILDEALPAPQLKEGVFVHEDMLAEVLCRG